MGIDDGDVTSSTVTLKFWQSTDSTTTTNWTGTAVSPESYTYTYPATSMLQNQWISVTPPYDPIIATLKNFGDCAGCDTCPYSLQCMAGTLPKVIITELADALGNVFKSVDYPEPFPCVDNPVQNTSAAAITEAGIKNGP